VTGDITITGRDTIIGSFCTFAPVTCSDNANILGSQPALILQAGRSELFQPSRNYPNTFFSTAFTQTGGPSLPGNVTVNGSINVGYDPSSSSSVRTGGMVFIEATGNIQTGNINAFRRNFFLISAPIPQVSLYAGGNITTIGNIDSSSTTNGSGATGGRVILEADSGNIIITGRINSSALLNQGQGTARGGDVTLQASTGSISTGAIDSSALVRQAGFAQGGWVSLNAGNPNNGNTSACNINGCNINFESVLTQGQGYH
jgi:hypothetical protein